MNNLFGRVATLGLSSVIVACVAITMPTAEASIHTVQHQRESNDVISASTPALVLPCLLGVAFIAFRKHEKEVAQ